MKYRVDTTDTHSHTVRISMEFIAPWDSPIIELPIWTPGSYKVREYSRHIYQISSGTHTIEKITKNQWNINAQEGSKIVLSYKIYAYDLTVRTSFLDDRYGLLSPASLFFYVIDDQRNHTKNQPVTIDVTIPENWKIFTSLPKDGNSYQAQDFDELVDSPFGLAHPEVLDTTAYKIDNFDGTSVPCEIAIIGHAGNQDLDHFKEQMIKLQKKSIEMFGSLPYDRYLWVLYSVGKGGGGLEHKYSNFSIINRWYFNGTDTEYAKLMSLEAHEHFHTYNIKRIRPSQLGPFEYHTEVYTKLLWVAEGMTSFYDNIFLPRSGIVKPEVYWKVIANDYSDHLKVEGRKINTIQESSFDAWIKYYLRHEGSHNQIVSYYLKGGLVSFMLDLEIRKQTNWKYSLDNFFQTMYNRYLDDNDGTYQESNLRQIIEEITGTDLQEFWDLYVNGTVEIPLNSYLNEIGMELKFSQSELPYTGLIMASNKTNVKKVRNNSPAMDSGVYSNDKLIAIDQYAIDSSTHDKILKKYSPGDLVNVTLVRDKILRKVEMKLGEYEDSSFKIVPMPEASEEKVSNRKQFLHQ